MGLERRGDCERDRLGRLLAALAYKPFATGIGLDENTAAFIDPDDRIEVLGSGGLTVIDPAQIEHSSMDSAAKGKPVSLIGVKLHILLAGDRYDLTTRQAEAAPNAADRQGGKVMKILDTSVYRGPNVYALFPMIRHKVDLGVLEDWPTGRLRVLAARGARRTPGQRAGAGRLT